MRTGLRGIGITTALAVLGPALAAPALASSGSRVETFAVPSACIAPDQVVMADPPPGVAPRPSALRVKVLLPAGYDGRRRFPVLYLLHGLGGAFDYWLKASDGELRRAVSGLGAIVVMPEAGVVATYANSWERGARRPCWEHYYLNELIPAIEDRYRVRPGRRWHAIGGFSSGGLGAVLYAARAPAYFGQVLSFSGVLSIQRPEIESGVGELGVMALFAPTKIAAVGPTPWKDAFGSPTAQEFYWAGHNPVVLATALSHSRIYVAHGGPSAPTCLDAAQPTTRCVGQEVVGGVAEASVNRSWAQEFVGAARATGADVTYRPQTGGHWYAYAARMLADAVGRWGLFAPVPERPTTWTYKTVATTGEMWGVRFAFEQPPKELVRFTRDGSRLRGEGLGTLRLWTSPGCTRRVTLPFDLDLSGPCS
jgi:S-formylglutathione hydrolase FrmB